jgi:hypothetical protein
MRYADDATAVGEDFLPIPEPGTSREHPTTDKIAIYHYFYKSLVSDWHFTVNKEPACVMNVVRVDAEEGQAGSLPGTLSGPRAGRTGNAAALVRRGAAAARAAHAAGRRVEADGRPAASSFSSLSLQEDFERKSARGSGDLGRKPLGAWYDFSQAPLTCTEGLCLAAELERFAASWR